ncbi:DUF2529 family protein [Planomicrobium sp. CPCC 101079]|uniref:DUF2529 family protein n=1 Tax=Planomicrobium sp. CPCC 101079 TaxID=2599618 RepID=UPI0011B4A147|nr:DUF2529 family protein [Planomicrobium sp. CPCC 101079]TWT03509.1 DUF2529 family protein [Planomicrobium sp. CPCC 101079]
MKMLTTQLTGLFQRISQQEEAIEDTARLLAQAAVGEGTIFLAAFGEMKAVVAAAINGAEPLPRIAEWQPDSIVTSADRIWILAKKDEGDELAGRLADAHMPLAMLAAETKETDMADAFISLKMDKGLLPADDGGRTLVPHAMGALYVYHAVKLLIDEMLAE